MQLDLQARDAEQAIRSMTGLLRANPAVLNVEQLCEDILAREQVNTTALGQGFALPHARTKAVSGLVLAVGRCRQGIPFGAGDRPAQLIFLIGTPPQMITQYLGLMGHLARLLKDGHRRQSLLDAENVEHFLAALR